MRKERFKEVLRKHTDIFDRDYLESIQKRRSTARSVAFKLFAVQVPILAFLVLTLIPVEASVTVFGVSPKASKNLREILVVVSAFCGALSAAINHYIDILSEIVACFAERRSKGEKDVTEFLGLGLGTNLWFLPSASYEQASLGLGFVAFLTMLALFGFAILGCALFGALYLQFLILSDIYSNPSFSYSTSVRVIGFVLVCDIFTLLLLFLSIGGMPLRDLANMVTVAKIGERDPERAARIYRAIALQHARRNWLTRIIFRPKMPKTLPRD